MEAEAAYGLWPLAFVNIALFIIFAASFFRPQTTRDWRAMGAYSAFLVAFFTEVYGIPLTLYLLSGWLSSTSPRSGFPTPVGTCGTNSSAGVAMRT